MDARSWPSSTPIVSASSLVFSNYFNEFHLPEATLKPFQNFIESIPIPLSVQEGLLQKSITSALLVTLFEDGKYYVQTHLIID